MNELNFRKLYASEIDCRVSTVTQKGCSILLYKDARVDQRLLDETVGAYNWQRSHEVINGNLFCNVGIYINRRGEGFGDWVWKQDVGKESYTEKEKGQASDAFKRACFNWGIGRELYTAPLIWINSKDAEVQKNGDRYTTRARFRVDAIGYKDDAISFLRITKGNHVVYEYGDASTIYSENTNLKDSEEDDMPETLTSEYINAHPDELVNNIECDYIVSVASKYDVSAEDICKAYKVDSLLKFKKATFFLLLNGDYWETIKRKSK